MADTWGFSVGMLIFYLLRQIITVILNAGKINCDSVTVTDTGRTPVASKHG